MIPDRKPEGVTTLVTIGLQKRRMADSGTKYTYFRACRIPVRRLYQGALVSVVVLKHALLMVRSSQSRSLEK